MPDKRKLGLSRRFSEDEAVESPAVALTADLGWQTLNCYEETFGQGGTLGRETKNEVVLLRRLQAALEKLNPKTPAESIGRAVEELTRGRSAMSMVEANRQVYRLLRDGVKVKVRRGGPASEEEEVRLRVVDWDNPANNDYLLASQLWITGEMYTRRADLVGFVNGLPLVFIELKASHRRLEDAYRKNLRDYKDTIPHLFWYNAVIILSNGSLSRIGTITSAWEHFSEWKKINDEKEEGIVSLEIMLRGVCDPARLLDLTENFTLFHQGKQGTVKLVAKNHQYLGVNAAIRALDRVHGNPGKLGVFWHAQGSGKSYSMIFFSQKVLRKVPGNWSFVVVTDREELDDQIHRNFSDCGAVTEPKMRAEDSDHLKRLLREDHRLVFTLIQKFRSEKGEEYEMVSDRSDVIVISDEAHRTQYEILAYNMRKALPNASFIAFTGTPLIAGEEKTRDVFGEHVSIYNYRESERDRNTVPLYYENRVPEMELTNKDLGDEMVALIDEAGLNEEQEQKLEREFAREYHLITRDDRLEVVAADLVAHFMGRGWKGKAMVISVDKATAVRMYDKVKAQWTKYLGVLRGRVPGSVGVERQELEDRIRYMERTDMAVVVSQSQNEIADMREKGLDMELHRRRMLNEDLDDNFKDPEDPLRIVFLCAMWMTGFDVPSCSTIYLDKPLRNHSLAQTIARANRVFGEKECGLIIDYIGIFRDLEKSLAIYAGGPGLDQSPVRSKQALIERMRSAVKEVRGFCAGAGVDLGKLAGATGFDLVRAEDQAVEAILTSEESRLKFFGLVGQVERLFAAILPDRAAGEFLEDRALFKVLVDKIRSELPEVDISGVMGAAEDLLERSVAVKPFMAKEADWGGRMIDLSQLDFGALRKRFAQGQKHLALERLKATIASTLASLVRQNRSRLDFLARFQALVDDYNSGSVSAEEMFRQLMAFAKELTAEEQRYVAEQLTEEELAVFDLLTRPDPKLKRSEIQQVKRVARELLEVLKHEKLVLDWRSRQQTRAAVRVCIEEELEKLPREFTRPIYARKCDAVYLHIYDSYWGEGRGIYAPGLAIS